MQQKDFLGNIFTNHPSTQGGGKPVNLGTKKFGDNPWEPLKCWECGEPHLRRNFPRLSMKTELLFIICRKLRWWVM
jgi:hypothetical protein